MAITYKNRNTGRVEEVLEPAELAEELSGVTVRGRPLDPNRVMLAKKRRERLLVKMDDCWKWQRVDGSTDTGDDSGGPIKRMDDPAEHGVNAVNAYLADADPDERERVLAAEADGKARSTILNGPHAGGG